MSEPVPPEVATLINARIRDVARQIGGQPLGLAYHLPEPWCAATQCFANVLRKVSADGGAIKYGWTFHYRYVESIPGPGYLFVTHHAVWHAPAGRLVCVTPYPDPKHHPLPGPGDNILFLVDDNAVPVVKGKTGVPLPLRFFPVGDDERLLRHVERRNAEEQEKFRAACDDLARGAPAGRGATQ